MTSEEQLSTGLSAVEKQSGVTSAERYLGQLCRRTFLSLWSYPGVYRDQGNASGGHGKEIADLLVVFGDDVVVFSDKDIVLSETGDLALAWRRWYRRAVEEGAQQVWGAARWVQTYPERVFLDRACSVPFPYPLPKPPDARYHCVVVAHGASKRCASEFGGSGSLMWVPPDSPTVGKPFVLTDLDPGKPFVHVLDDTALAIVMRECDTISDFVAYLRKKEGFLRSGKFVTASGEEDLLAYYLTHMNSEGEHDFSFDGEYDGFLFDEGHYKGYSTDPGFLRKKSADKVSYMWDTVIERFSDNILAGTLDPEGAPTMEVSEAGLRLLARENRVRRRMLAKSFLNLLVKAKTEQAFMYARVVEPSEPQDPYFLFFLLKPNDDMSYSDYRDARKTGAIAYARVLRLERPNAHTIVAIAAEVPGDRGGSEDLLVYDGRNFSDEDRKAAIQARAAGFFKDIRRTASVESEYPDEIPKPPTVFPRRGGRYPGTSRNDLCPCGSEMKYKKCCGP